MTCLLDKFMSNQITKCEKHGVSPITDDFRRLHILSSGTRDSFLVEHLPTSCQSIWRSTRQDWQDWQQAGCQEVGMCSSRGGFRGMYIMFASAMPMALKPREDITRNSKQGYQWLQNRTHLCPPKNFKKRVKYIGLCTRRDVLSNVRNVRKTNLHLSSQFLLVLLC